MSVTYQIKGMGCSACVDKIQEELSKNPQIQAIVSLDKNTIEIKTPNVPKEVIQQILTKAGHYTLL